MKDEKDKNVRIPKWVKVLIIVFGSFLGAISSLWIIGGISTLIKNSSIHYVERLKDYKLSKIVGKVGRIESDEYTKKIKEITTINNYRAYEIDMLPKDIPSETNYFFFAETVQPNKNFHDRFERFLECKWREEEFELECKRLESIHNGGKYVLYSEDLFTLPAFVIQYNYSAIFEYALIDKSDFKIYYIWMDEIGSLENIVFDMSFAPTKRLQDSDLAKKTNYGIYTLY